MKNNLKKIVGLALISTSGLAIGTCLAQPVDTRETEVLSAFEVTNSDAGHSVAISGDVAVVGRPGYSGSVIGDAVIFRYNGTQWLYEATLVANDGITNDEFGHSVAIFEDMVVVGRTDLHLGITGGSAFVYKFDGANWNFETKLVPDDGGIGDSGNAFGVSVSITGDSASSYTIAVGDNLEGFRINPMIPYNSGTVHVFHGSNGVWDIGQKLTPFGHSQIQKFGSSVSVDGDFLVVGSPFSQGVEIGGGPAIASGTANIFKNVLGVWTDWIKIEPELIQDHTFFGASVSISDDMIAVGADGDRASNNDQDVEGAAYIYRLANGVWSLEQELEAFDGDTGDNFGSSISISGDTVVIGAKGDSDASPAAHGGSASVFQFYNGVWTETDRLYSSTPTNNDNLGSSVGISDDRIIVGVPGDDVNNVSNSGSAHIYNSNVCLSVDFNQDGVVNFFDVSFFLSGFNIQLAYADIDNDGDWDFFDVSAFLQAYSGQGC